MSERLYRQGEERKKRREAALKEAPEGCTFKPALNSKAKSKKTGAALFDRLHSDGQKKAQKMEQMRKDSETKDCTFKPELSSVSKKIAKRNSKVHDSLYLVGAY